MCAPCKHKQQQAARQLAMQKSLGPTQTRNVRLLENITFLSLYYVGPTDVEIPTLVPNVAYGTKEYGAFMYVAKQDFDAHPELWTESDPR